MKIGIIAAMDVEMNLLLERLENSVCEKYCGCEYYSGTIGDKDIVVTRSGLGKVNAAIAVGPLKEFYECDLVINTGIAGGIEPLNHRDIILASRLTYFDVDARDFGYQYGQVPGMPLYYYPSMDAVVLVKSALNKLNVPYKFLPIYSGDSFVTSMKMLGDTKIDEPGAIEMEGCAIAQACTRMGIDFIILRYISDIIGEENQTEDYFKFEADMSRQSAEICFELLKNL